MAGIAPQCLCGGATAREDVVGLGAFEQLRACDLRANRGGNFHGHAVAVVGGGVGFVTCIGDGVCAAQVGINQHRIFDTAFHCQRTCSPRHAVNRGLVQGDALRRLGVEANHLNA